MCIFDHNFPTNRLYYHAITFKLILYTYCITLIRAVEIKVCACILVPCVLYGWYELCAAFRGRTQNLESRNWYCPSIICIMTGGWQVIRISLFQLFLNIFYKVTYQSRFARNTTHGVEWLSHTDAHLARPSSTGVCHGVAVVQTWLSAQVMVSQGRGGIGDVHYI